ncbi:hypothetical protein EI94DRAFT_1891712, partial [Lactarius quietus]
MDTEVSELAQQTGAPHRRGRIRAYIFHGIKRFGMARAIATMPLLLNISVFLFFAGLLDFLFPINKPVSYHPRLCRGIRSGIRHIDGFTHLVLRLPLCYTPVRTHLVAIPGFRDRRVKGRPPYRGPIHNPLLKLWSRVNKRITGSSVHEWRESLKSQVKVHRSGFLMVYVRVSSAVPRLPPPWQSQLRSMDTHNSGR